MVRPERLLAAAPLAPSGPPSLALRRSTSPDGEVVELPAGVRISAGQQQGQKSGTWAGNAIGAPGEITRGCAARPFGAAVARAPAFYFARRRSSRTPCGSSNFGRSATGAKRAVLGQGMRLVRPERLLAAAPLAPSGPPSLALRRSTSPDGEVVEPPSGVRISADQKQGQKSGTWAGNAIGAPGEIRTPDLLVRSQALYPTELRAHRAIDNTYRPRAAGRHSTTTETMTMAEREGFEPSKGF